jgi:aryl-alcohol dehydrogenase-like predicted oxidoreductase
MEYRFLGNTGLKVSVLSFGNWLTSNKREQIYRNVALENKPMRQESAILILPKVTELVREKFNSERPKQWSEEREIVVSTKIFWQAKLTWP